MDGMNLPVIQYEHLGRQVSVLEQLKGKYRKHNLCQLCEKYTPDNHHTNCRIANAIFDNAVDFSVVTPVYECPEFVVRRSTDIAAATHPLVYNDKPIRKIYVAGPMRRYPMFNFPAFDRAAELGRSLGYTVITPAEISRANGYDPTKLPSDYDWSGWFPNENPDQTIRCDFDAVMSVDALVLLQGFGESTGATFERAAAAFRGLPFLNENYEFLTVT